ncbi:UDP-N-acetylglucosamine 1-carboxyvinyltransferase [Streptococcus pseudopneumoniae]|nr:UDP-N-acetylglucosamine 1-carboxyvinyltransferase [Streptococcus pseudopneumoniae]TMR54304.1 UDP-N-acetylglucosamine 1-carboxyvinyltransferase [Streptococcus pseudopneumoniae]
MIVGSNPSTAFQYRIYRNLSRQKARKLGLFYFFF